MKLKKIQDIDLANKKILMRVDFNVVMNDDTGEIVESFRIDAVKETVNYILEQPGTKLALIAHLGRPDGKVVMNDSLVQIVPEVARLLGRPVSFVCDCINDDVDAALESIDDNEVLLLENLRFHPGEKEDDHTFAQKLASPFDLYVNDAFAVSHRAHASVHAITHFLPSAAGMLMQHELDNLGKVKEIDKTERPAVAIIGGAKINTKLPLIKQFEKKYDVVLVGGRIAIEAQEQQMIFSDSVILPVDYAKDKLDIGPETIKLFVEKVKGAKLITWNGPMGKFEQKPFDAGTRTLVDVIANDTDAFSLIGGGESVQALNESGRWDDISFVSTGGGAMLSFLSGEKMPGLEALVIEEED